MRGMIPEDVYELTWVADPRVSPDGTTVAYMVAGVDKDENSYKSDIWLVDTEGSAEPRQITFGPKRNADPRWSPDGSSLAFVSNRDSDSAQLYVISLAGGEARRLTDLKEDVSEVVWSPDGSRLAFVARVRHDAYEEEDEKKRPPRRVKRLQYKLDNVGWIFDRRGHVFAVAADGSSEPKQITDGDFEDSGPAWSPDGATIAFASGRAEDWDIEWTSDIHVLGADGGTPELLTAGDATCLLPSWSPDGTRIAYAYTPGVLDYPRHAQIATIDVRSREQTILTQSLDRNCMPYPPIREPVWDGDDLVFGVEDSGNTHLYCVPADGSGKPEAMVEGELGVTGYDVVSDTVVYSASTYAMLPELFVGDKRLTKATAGFADDRRLVEAERFTATSPHGSEIDAWIMRPADFEPGTRYPVLLNIHGGPFTQYGTKFFDEFQVYAGAGYAVLFCNPRGSSGYSEEWGRAIRGPASGGPGMGTVDFDDVMAVVDQALDRFDFCDSERLGVMGGSYGGFLTSWIVGHDHRFKAACSERAVNDWYSFYGSSDAGWAFKGYVGAFLHEDPESYLKMSPATYAQDIETPLLIIHSENDLRCDVEQAERLFVALRLLKKDVELVRFTSESHELTRSGNPIHRVARFQILIDFFDRYLKDGSQQTS
ncbi:MAG: S9 family peptidase [Actinomycetota bacterium]